MSGDLLISDDWVAIRDFSFVNVNKNSSSCDDLKVSWDDDKHLVHIHFKKKDNYNNDEETLSQDDINNNFSVSQWEHNVSYLVDAFAGTHELLLNLIPEFDVTLPVMPTQRRGFWGYLSSSVVPANFESNLTDYLLSIKNILGEKEFLQQYFDIPSDEDHLEDLNELNRSALLEDLHAAKELLVEVRNLRQSSINLLDTLSIYSIEDEAHVKVDLAEAVLYNFERQPFIELREVARESYRQLRRKLAEVVSEDEKVEISQSCLKWQNELKNNEICLSDLQLNYFEKCFSNLTWSCDLMVEDEAKYGEEFKISSGKERLSRKRTELCNVTLQLLRVKKKKLIIKREDIKAEVCQLYEGEHLEESLLALEKKFYKLQVNIFDLRMQILSEEERLYRMQLQEYQRFDAPPCEYRKTSCEGCSENMEHVEDEQADGVQEEDEEDNFEDCVEKIEEQEEVDKRCYENETSGVIDQFLAGLPVEGNVESSKIENANAGVETVNGVTESCALNSEEWIQKQNFIKMLNRVFRKRAWLRNKQRKFAGEWKKKIDVKKAVEDTYVKHHAVHLKREKNKAAMEKKKTFLQNERKKTIERLKQYRNKNPNEPIRVPARYAVPLRRTRSQMTSVPFRPGGPTVILPGSSVSLRIRSDAELTVRKTASHEKPVKKNVEKDEIGKNTQNEIIEKVKDTEIKTISDAPTTHPPPPPPPPPPPMPPPPPPTSASPKSRNHVEKKLQPTFPVPPTNNNYKPSNQQQNSGIDLSSIINARTRLKKPTPVVQNCKLSDVTANILINALNKMKKYTGDSTDEDDGDDDDAF